MTQPGTNLGARIRTIRKSRELTLEDLSGRCGVAVSTLSKIENERSNASVDTILKVARGLGVLFDALVRPETDDATPSGRRVITRRGEAERFPTALYDYDIHGADLVRKGMLPLVMRIKARDVPDIRDWSTHRGEEFVLVLSGAIDLHTEHYAPARLEPGDSAYFDSLMRHAFVTVGDDDAVILSISLTDGSAPGPQSRMGGPGDRSRAGFRPDDTTGHRASRHGGKEACATHTIIDDKGGSGQCVKASSSLSRGDRCSPERPQAFC